MFFLTQLYIQIIIIILIFGLLSYFTMGVVERILEVEVGVQHKISKSVKLTYCQILFIILFFALSQAYYISNCSKEHCPLENDLAVWIFCPSILLFCPVNNILALPMICLAFYVYNSNILNFSCVHPVSGLQWNGRKIWNGKTGKWEIDESPAEHEVFEL